MFGFGCAGKKKDELDEWLADELFPIIISGDQLAVQAPPPKPKVESPKTAAAPSQSKVSLPPPKAKTIKKFTKGSIPGNLNTGMVSIKSMLNESEKKAEEEEIEDFSDRPRTPFTEEEFKAKWTAYIESLQKDKRASLASTLLSCQPEIKENFKLNMVFDNIVQEAEFNNEKSDLLGFLREGLNNWGIHIVSEVREVKERKKYYTNRERFERMVEINPKLELLRKRLNLDPDY